MPVINFVLKNIDDFHVDAYLKAFKKPIEIQTKAIETQPKSIVVPKVVTKVEEKRTTNVKALPKKTEIKTTTTSKSKPITTTKPVEVKKTINNKLPEVKKTTTTSTVKLVEETKTETPTPANKEHFSRFGLHDKIFEIHGNIQYMRCDNDCTNELFSSPKVGCDVNFVPECPKCKGVAR